MIIGLWKRLQSYPNYFGKGVVLIFTDLFQVFGTSTEEGDGCRPRHPLPGSDEGGGESWSQQHGGEVQTLCVYSVILPPQPSEAVGVLVVPPPFFLQHLNQEALGLTRKELVIA